MKKILLLGDSIRMGYDKYVKLALSDVAEVYYPPDNCRFGVYLLRFAGEWKNNFNWPDDIDLVHWNAGLWDVIRLYGDEPITTPEYYENMIARIDKRLRTLFPNAKMVFATSTTVDEEKYGQNFKRLNSDIERYNEIAKKVLSSGDTVIDDLYSVSLGCNKECRSDPTHFNTTAGRRLMGNKVISVLCEQLDIPKAKINIFDVEPENYSKQNIGR